MSEVATNRIEDRKSRFMHGFDADKLLRHREGKEIELRRQQRHDQNYQIRNISNIERDWIQVNQLYKSCYTVEDMGELLQAAASNDDSQILYAAQGFRKMLSVKVNTPIQDVIDTGIVPRILEWTQRYDFSQLQYEACWVLTNISAGNSSQTQSIIEKGAVFLLIKMLSSSNETVRDQAVWALGNIAGDSSTSRDMIIHFDGLNLVMKIGANSHRPSMMKNIYWTISNLCRGKPPPHHELVKDAMPVLVKAIMTEDAPDLLSDCLYSILYISGTKEHIQTVSQVNVVLRLVELMNHFAQIVQLPSLKIIGNIASGSKEHTQLIIDQGGLVGIFDLLHSTSPSIVKEAVWVCSNISAGTNEQLQSLFDTQIFKRIVNLVIEADFEIKNDAVWAICNAAAGAKPEQISFLVRCNAIYGLCNVLKNQFLPSSGLSDAILIALQGLSLILQCGKANFSQAGVNPFASLVEESGGLKALEDLQGHYNQSVYELALHLLENFFELEADDNEDLLKAIQHCSQYNF